MMQQTLLPSFFSPSTTPIPSSDEGVGSTEVVAGGALSTSPTEQAYDWAALERTVVAPDVHRFQRDLLVGDTHLGRCLSAGACAWGDVSALAFVRAEVLGDAGVLLSVARFDERGAGAVTSVLMADAFAFERARAALAGAQQVVIVGHNVEDVSPLLDFDARIVARRSSLSLRAHEVGVLRALRDEAWHLGGRLRQEVDPTDSLTVDWLVQRAEAEVLSLVVSSLPTTGHRAHAATLH